IRPSAVTPNSTAARCKRADQRRSTAEATHDDASAQPGALTVTASNTISIVVIFHEMRREAARTLFTLTRGYQRDCALLQYEVIAVDHGSRRAPLAPEFVASFGANFRHIHIEPGSPSPARACNRAVEMSIGDIVMVMIDGARMLSPGVLRYTACAFEMF